MYYFFSLSGFLILRLIYVELKTTSDFDFKKFFLRRIQRLYPVYYLVVFIGIAFYYFIMPKMGSLYKANPPLLELVLYYVFLMPNVFRYKYGNTGSILIILWSIGVEEQFYLFIPGFMYIFKKKIVFSILVLLIILLLLLFLFPTFYNYTNYYFYFLFAGLLSIVSLNKKIWIFKNKIVQVVIYLLSILSFFTTLFNFHILVLYHFFNMLVSGLLITMISDYPIFIITNKLLDRLGKVSYGIYAYHMIIITGILYLISRYKPYQYFSNTAFISILNLIIIALTAFIANLSYKYFETLFYKRKHGMAQKNT